jgi:hypothetical protein
MAAAQDVATGKHEQVACYCWRYILETSNIIRFDQHPRDGVCIGCAAWLHKRSLPILHKTYPPFWWRLTPKRFHGA